MRKFTKSHKLKLSKAIKKAYKRTLFCQKTQFKSGRPPELNINWKGGRQYRQNDYTTIYAPFHPSGNHSYPYRLEHRIVMEANLNKVSLKMWIEWGRNGKYPPNAIFLQTKEIVHHINGKRNDNRLKNLMLFPNKSAHHKFQHLGKKLFICKFCGKNQKD